MLWLKISLLVASIIQGLAQTCPTTQCRCLQIRRDWHIDCSASRLQAVPRFDASETVWKSLLLDYNSIVDIPANAFRYIKVQEIDLSYNDIASLSVSAFSGQENVLEKVSLSGNSLTALPNKLFQNFQRLKVLGLSSNSLAALPDDLTTLEELYLIDNKLSSLPANLTVGLTHLKRLELGRNGFSYIPPLFFRSTSDLEILDLTENKLTNFTDGVFTNLKRLRQLTLYENGFKGKSLGFIRELNSSMEYLNIAYNKLTKISFETFANFSNLVNLDLKFNEIVSIDNDSMVGFPNLKWFTVYGNAIKTIADNAFENNRHLEDVDFGRNNLVRVPTVALQPLTKLKTLSLWANRIDHVGEDDLKIPAPGLKSLILGDNTFHTLQAGAFSSLKSLQHIDCAQGHLTHLPDTIFDGLSQLFRLLLERNSLSSIPKGIKALTGLQVLDLSYNDINEMKGDEFPEKGFSNLILGHNPLSQLPQNLYHNPYLSSLDVSSINITGVGYICDAVNQKNLRYFYLENNPLHCGCEMLWLRRAKVRLARVPSYLTCATPPSLAGKEINELLDSEFKCTTTIEEACPVRSTGTISFANSIILLFLFCRGLAYLIEL